MELCYKGYQADIEYDPDDKIFVGKVLGVRDSLNFHGETLDELKYTLQRCIDNYIEMQRILALTRKEDNND